MHIMEGFLPVEHAIGWSLVAAPFVVMGARRITKLVAEKPETKLLLAASGAFAFVLSALKLPSVTGSCSHPTGTGLGAVLFGPSVMTIMGAIVLLFQALLLAHGGITTLGANIVSMAVAGPYVAWAVWMLARRFGATVLLAVFLAATLGNLATYMVTSAQLAFAFPDPVGGFAASFIKFAGIFGITQVPLAIAEGLLSAMVMNLLNTHSRDELQSLKLVSGEAAR